MNIFHEFFYRAYFIFWCDFRAYLLLLVFSGLFDRIRQLFWPPKRISLSQKISSLYVIDNFGYNIVKFQFKNTRYCVKKRMDTMWLIQNMRRYCGLWFHVPINASKKTVYWLNKATNTADVNTEQMEIGRIVYRFHHIFFSRQIIYMCQY